MDTGDSFAYVKFVSDSSENATGFSLSFEASVEGRSTFKLQSDPGMIPVLVSGLFQAISFHFIQNVEGT